MSHSVGIEWLNIYGLSGYVDQRSLARARGLDPDRVVDDFLIDRRAINPLYEDVITMAVNAAKPLCAHIDPQEIGLLAVGTESSLDNGKPISTNIHGALGLSENVRNFETKHACYSGNASLQLASDWIQSGSSRGKKALVISTDFSRMHIAEQSEFVLGGVASAVIISDTPEILAFEADRRGVWTTDVYDTFRPTARHEIGNNEVSLFTYIDALKGSYDHYCQEVGKQIDYQKYFAYNIFHTPFPGMAFQAHRSLFNIHHSHPKREVMDDFNARVLPGLRYARQVGSSYGASNIVGLAGLITSTPDIPEGTRVGLFSYGSGAIGEFYSGRIGAQASSRIAAMRIDDALASRHEVSVDEYESLEKRRAALIESQSAAIPIDRESAWYATQYSDAGRYILQSIDNFRRTYTWS